ncbi:dihydrofolate reductase [Rhodococcus sp. KBW08]|nr:dihydrofolate reductase [Rhodococcus sp. KBW08]
MAAVTSAPPVTSATVGSADVGAEESASQSDSNPSTSILSLPSPGKNPPTGVEIAETNESAVPAGDRTPEEIVAEAGPRGQDYLRALRARGVPALGMDSVEISFANGTCAALGSGMPRTEVLNEFDSVGEALATGTGLESGQIAEAYVSAAEQTYC